MDAHGRMRVVRYLCAGERVSYLLPGADPIYGLCALDRFAAQCTSEFARSKAAPAGFQRYSGIAVQQRHLSLPCTRKQFADFCEPYA